MPRLFGPNTPLARGKFKPFGYLYIVRWTDEIIKIGTTGNPYQRLLGHRSFLGNELRLIGAILKFTSPQLAYEVEQHVHHEFGSIQVRNELFKWPEVAQEDADAVRALGDSLRSVLVEKLKLAQPGPERGYWEMSPESWDDPIVHAAESPFIWEQTEPLPPRPKSVSARSKFQDPVLRSERSEAARKQWQDPDFRARWCDTRRKRCQAPEVKAAMSEKGRKQWEDPALRAERAEKTRKQWEDPATRAAFLNRSRQSRSEATRKVWASGKRKPPVFRTRTSPNQLGLFE